MKKNLLAALTLGLAAAWLPAQAATLEGQRFDDAIKIGSHELKLNGLGVRGLLLAVNDVAKGNAISGADFYNAVLEIFVGDNPVDGRLKKGMLGQ